MGGCAGDVAIAVDVAVLVAVAVAVVANVLVAHVYKRANVITLSLAVWQRQRYDE